MKTVIDPQVEEIYREWFYSGGVVTREHGGLPEFREWAREKYPDIYRDKMVPLESDEVAI